VFPSLVAALGLAVGKIYEFAHSSERLNPFGVAVANADWISKGSFRIQTDLPNKLGALTESDPQEWT
jgi:hypothetical protein